MLWYLNITRQTLYYTSQQRLIMIYIQDNVMVSLTSLGRHCIILASSA